MAKRKRKRQPNDALSRIKRDQERRTKKKSEPKEKQRMLPFIGGCGGVIPPPGMGFDGGYDFLTDDDLPLLKPRKPGVEHPSDEKEA